MWKVSKIEASNIGPFEKIDYTLADVPKLVLGNNQVDENQQSNGVGKSFLLDAFAFGLSGHSIKKCRTIELIRFGCAEATIKVTLINSENETLFIRRVISTKRNSTCQVTLNGDDIVCDSVNEYNSRILTILGITKDQLFSYYLISRLNYNSFLSSSPNEKKKLVLKFSGATIIDDILVENKTYIKDVQGEVEIAKGLLTSLMAKKEKVKGTYEGLKKFDPSDVIQKYKESISKQEAYIESAKPQVSEAETHIQGKKNELTKAIEAVSDKTKDYQHLSKVLADAEKEKNVLQKEKDAILANREHLNKKSEYEVLRTKIATHIKGAVTCPECKHQFSLSTTKTLDELKATDEKLSKAIIQLNENIAIQKKEGEDIDTKIQSIDIARLIQNRRDGEEGVSECNRSVEAIKRTIKDNEENIKKLHSNIKECESIIELQKQSIKEAQAESLNNKEIQEVVSRFRAVTKSIEEQESAIKEIQEKESKYLSIAQGLEAFKIHLCNKSIGGLQNRINELLASVSDVKVDITMYRKLASGKTSEEVSPKIIRNGTSRDFTTFSSGEMARIEICVILALQAMTNDSTRGKGLNQLFIDEILGEVDEVGIADIMVLLDKYAPLSHLITHTGLENISKYSHLKVVKSKNCAYISECPS